MKRRLRVYKKTAGICMDVVKNFTGDKSDYITGNSLGGMLTIRFNK